MPAAEDDLHLTDDPGPAVLAAVGALLDRAAVVDLSPPLNEAALLALKHPGRGDTRHLVALRGDDPVGYAQLAADGTGQLVVDPLNRRQGVGALLVRSLLEAARRDAVQLRVWALGDSPAAQALAARTGLAPMRTLLVMRRPLVDLPEPVVPDGIVITTFRSGLDEQAWLRVNARAFAHHPEQGGMTLRDLELREAEDWFDSAGFLLAWRTAGDGSQTLLGSHWTKVHPAGEVADEAVGEVYVLGVDPDAQGLRLGRALTDLGLAHLRGQGLSDVLLYVEEDNTTAVALYEKSGFTRFAVDVQWHREIPRD